MGIPAVPLGPGRWCYRDYAIHYDPPPIPLRNCDYQWAHADYDGGYYDAEGVLCEADRRCGASGSLAEAMADIDEQIEEGAS